MELRLDQVAEETRAERARSKSLQGAGGKKQGIRYGGTVSEARVWGRGASATPLHNDKGQCQAVLCGGKQRRKMGTGLRMQQLLREHLSMDCRA